MSRLDDDDDDDDDEDEDDNLLNLNYKDKKKSMNEIRESCQWVVQNAEHVSIDEKVLKSFAEKVISKEKGMYNCESGKIIIA